jgi:hypothetical protein
MEALLERGTDVENWNDDRLDELSGRMDTGFKEMRDEMRDGFAEINRKLDRIPTREEIDHRFEATESRIGRVSNRLEHMVWGLFAVGGGLLANLLAGNF